MSIFTRFAKDESGATAIEYGLIAALVGVALIASLGKLKDGLVNVFGGTGDKLKTVTF